MSIDLPDEASTGALGTALAQALPGLCAGEASGALEPFVIGLRGELGAGKTTLARALLRGLGHAGRVPSPTYTLVEPYAFDWGTVYHIDLYRLTKPEELLHLGLEDCIAPGVVWLVEWPERAAGTAVSLDVDIHLAVKGSTRCAEIEGRTARGRAVLRAVRFPVSLES